MNVMLGSTSRTHTVTRQLRAKGAPRTAHEISQLGVYCEDNVGPLDVSGLEHALRDYWRFSGVGQGVYPIGAKIELGSRIRLFAADTHAPLGFAVGHPSLDSRARYDRCARCRTTRKRPHTRALGGGRVWGSTVTTVILFVATVCSWQVRLCQVLDHGAEQPPEAC